MLKLIDGWTASRGFQLTHQKSEAVKPPKLFYWGPGHQLGKALEIPRRYFDSRLTFMRSVENVAKRATNSAVALSVLCLTI